MAAVALRKEVIPLRTSPPHPAAKMLGERADAAKARFEASTGYRRTRAPEWLLTLLAPVAGILLMIAVWALIAKQGGRIPDPITVWHAAAKIFADSLWPMIVNTAVGLRQIPQDYLNVARVLNLSERKVFTKILFPAVLPYMITGVRLSIGVAWLVIVAAEMLTGGVGIGFWVWDEWNNLKVEHIIIAIFTIGIVGLLLEQSLVLLAKRFSYT